MRAWAGHGFCTGTGPASRRPAGQHYDFRQFPDGVLAKRTTLHIIDRQVPDGLDVHIVAANYSMHRTAMIQRWLDRHPRFHMRFTPTYPSWINQVERLFAEVTRDLLQRSDQRSVQSLEADLRKWVRVWNEDPQPFV